MFVIFHVGAGIVDLVDKHAELFDEAAWHSAGKITAVYRWSESSLSVY